ncbi:MAG TPA: cytochrome c biogenesis protein CcdA [Eubacteriaceae bacterium]|nr:cytochrome c biogenesis protein CcdA [Eubacteriaceae bacterium]
MENIGLFVAFTGGLLSFISPCVIPLVPAYVGYLTGSMVKDTTQKTDILPKALGFVLGFSFIFVLLGISVTSISALFIQNQELFQKIGGVFVIIMGIHVTGLIKIRSLNVENRPFFNKIGKKPLGSIVMGMAFATGWTPCIGPILSSILIFAGSTATVSQGALLLIAYSLGLAIPFIVVALLMDQFQAGFKKFSKYLPLVSIISGILLIIMGILIFTDSLIFFNTLF